MKTSPSTPFEKSLVAAFETLAKEPPWLSDLRRSALARFEALGLPTSRHEDWRFTDLSALSAQSFGRPAPAADGALLLERASTAGVPRLVFANGRYRPDLSCLTGLPPGVLAKSLRQALSECPEQVMGHIGRIARFDEHPFVAANTALFEDGAFLLFPEGLPPGCSISLVFLTEPGVSASAVFPRVLIVAEKGAQAAVEEIFLGKAGGAYLNAAVTEIALGEGASVEHVRLQLEADEAYHVGVVSSASEQNSSLLAHAFSLGGLLSRSELRARLGGPFGSVAANGLYMADGVRRVDNFSWVEHAVPNCTTTETYKGILDGRSRGVFSGRIVVRPGAQKTNAYQMNSNLLLSEEAVIDTKPQLEIFADDVKCGHGGTVGQLDEAALFYLRSRGLPEDEAQSLLVWAFASEMVGRIGPAPLRAHAKNLVAARLPSGSRLLEALA